jgi:hypothetical protein
MPTLHDFVYIFPGPVNDTKYVFLAIRGIINAHKSNPISTPVQILEQARNSANLPASIDGKRHDRQAPALLQYAAHARGMKNADISGLGSSPFWEDDRADLTPGAEPRKTAYCVHRLMHIPFSGDQGVSLQVQDVGNQGNESAKLSLRNEADLATGSEKIHQYRDIHKALVVSHDKKPRRQGTERLCLVLETESAQAPKERKHCLNDTIREPVRKLLSMIYGKRARDLQDETEKQKKKQRADNQPDGYCHVITISRKWAISNLKGLTLSQSIY